MSPAAGRPPARRIGIDVGGSKALGVVVDRAGEVLAEERRPTPRGPDSLDALLDTLVDIAVTLGAPAPLRTDAPRDRSSGSVTPNEAIENEVEAIEVGVGIGVPGLVTPEGVLRAAPNLDGVNDFTVAATLAERTGWPVVVDNDATCAAVAEYEHGTAQGRRDVVLVTLGTGIGGAVIVDGALRRGHHGFAGEFGHMVVDPDGPLCPCGGHGCWERYASGAGLTRLGREAAAAGHLDAVRRSVGGDPSDVGGEDVERAAVGGDPDALAVVDDFARWVAIGLANLTNALDPELFVLGGGLSAGGELYGRPIRAWLGDVLYQSHLRPVPAVEFAAFGERAGAIGAALLGGRHTATATGTTTGTIGR